MPWTNTTPMRRSVAVRVVASDGGWSFTAAIFPHSRADRAAIP
jgi:hypothetical protein